jgi:hypothetical protein
MDMIVVGMIGLVSGTGDGKLGARMRLLDSSR